MESISRNSLPPLAKISTSGSCHSKVHDEVDKRQQPRKTRARRNACSAVPSLSLNIEVEEVTEWPENDAEFLNVRELVTSPAFEKECLERSLRICPSELNMVDLSGDSLLHLACMVGNQEAVDVLLNLGADVDTRNSRGEDALELCILCSQLDCLSLLLEHLREQTSHMVENKPRLVKKIDLLAKFCAYKEDYRLFQLLIKFKEEVLNSQ